MPKELNKVLQEGKEQAMTLAFEKGDIEEIGHLFKTLDLSQSDRNKYLAQVIESSYDKKLEIIDVLIQKGADIKGADVNAKGKDGFTPLHRAAQSGNLDEVKFLLKNGANPDIKNKWGQTALHVVMLSTSEDNKREGQAIVNSLLDHGASVNIKDNQFKTAKDLAKKRGFGNLAEYAHKQSWKEYAQGANPNTEEVTKKIKTEKDRIAKDRQDKNNAKEKEKIVLKEQSAKTMDAARDKIDKATEGNKTEEELKQKLSAYDKERLDVVDWKKTIKVLHNAPEVVTDEKGNTSLVENKNKIAIGRPKLRKMLESFRHQYINGNSSETIDGHIEAAKKYAISKLSKTERASGVLATGMTDLKIFEQIVETIKKEATKLDRETGEEKIDIFKDLSAELKKPKRIMRTMFEGVKKAMPSLPSVFYMPGRKKSTGQSKGKEL